MNSMSSPLCLQERESSASLLQVYHSQRESLFQETQSILASTVRPVHWMSAKRKSNPEVDNCPFRNIFEKRNGTIARRSKTRDLET